MLYDKFGTQRTGKLWECRPLLSLGTSVGGFFPTLTFTDRVTVLMQGL